MKTALITFRKVNTPTKDIKKLVSLFEEGGVGIDDIYTLSFSHETAFLKIVEDRLMAWVDSNTARNFAWDELWQYEWALEHFQKALLEQAMYMYRNSDILMDSGYDPDSGIIAKREDLLKIAVAESAINLLKVGGIFNQVMTNRRRYLDFK